MIDQHYNIDGARELAERFRRAVDSLGLVLRLCAVPEILAAVAEVEESYAALRPQLPGHLLVDHKIAALRAYSQVLRARAN